MTFRKTACLTTMLMCCSQTAYASYGNNWDDNITFSRFADATTLTSSGFSEVFAAGGTQKIEEYDTIYIGHASIVSEDVLPLVNPRNIVAESSNNNGVMGAGLSADTVVGGTFSLGATMSDLVGSTFDIEAKGNKITLESGSKVHYATGGGAYFSCAPNYCSGAVAHFEGVVSGNSVKAEEGASVDALMGGFAWNDCGGIESFSVQDNTVAATGGTVGVINGGYANSVKAYVCKNTVLLNNIVVESGSTSVLSGTITFQNTIIGGVCAQRQYDYLLPMLWNTTYDEGAHIASENTVIINNSTVDTYVSGGVASGTYKSYKLDRDTVTASGNTVTLSNTEFSGKEINGGYASSHNPYDSGNISVTANENKIVLNGGSYSSEEHSTVITGGFAVSASTTGEYSAEASNNRIELRNGSQGAPVFSEDTLIWGGHAYTETKGSNSNEYTLADGISTGNSLNFYDVKEMKAGNIDDFQVLNYEYHEMRAGDAIMELTGAGAETDGYGSITVTSDAAQATSIANAEVRVLASLSGKDGGEFEIGDEVVLLKNTSGIDAEGISQSVTAAKGVTILYDAYIETNDDNTELLLKSRGKTVNPGTKAIAEGTASGLVLAGALVNTTIDLLRDLSFVNGAVTPFVHTQGSSMRYETGSSINMSTVSLAAGLGYGIETGAGDLGIGAFFEYGKGAYTTSNSFDSRSDINGDGTSWCMGAGMLAKMEFLQTGPGHFYLEGSAHLGTMHNEYDSNDLTDVFGNSAKFDMDSPYFSLHGGLGYVWNFAEGHDLDMYGMYIWTRVQGTDDTLTTSDTFEYDDMDSNRVRFGVRYTYNGSERFSPYVGVAYEHEFSGSCDSKMFGHPVAAPSIEGSSGMGELGLMMKPSEDVPLSINLGVQGYVGQKQGISGNFTMVYEF